MKRTDISELFPDATKEQIDKLLGINGADINSAKGETDALRTQLAAVQAQLQKQQPLAGQTELQKQVDALQKELNGMKQVESLRTMREKVSAEKKIPANLLTGDTEEACVAQADSILAFAQSSGYPSVPDKGEVHGAHGPSDKIAAGYTKLAADLFGEKS